jgi:hypothetical protein
MALGFALLAAQLAALGQRQIAQASGKGGAAALTGALTAAGHSGTDDSPLAKAYRFESGGWIYVHLEGSPHDIGYQHGYLLAPEIADAYAAVSLQMTHTTKRDWEFAPPAKCSGRKSIPNIRRSFAASPTGSKPAK